MKKAAYLLDTQEPVFGERTCAEIAELVDVRNGPTEDWRTAVESDGFGETEILFGGWGTPRLDRDLLDSLPRLRALFYAAGSIRNVVSDAFWERDIVICTAWTANSIPVMEYTLSQILFSLKQGHRVAALYRETRSFDEARVHLRRTPGAHRSTVGLIGMGVIGGSVAERLRQLEVDVVVYDPYLTRDEAANKGVQPVKLDALFALSDVVSLHAPWCTETEEMITGVHLRSMKRYATFINTARGAIVREPELIATLQDRPDLFAVLDVTHPEPPDDASPLWTLPNVLLTPHMAGSAGRECRRMGEYMLEDLRRYLEGRPLKWRITAEQAAIMA